VKAGGLKKFINDKLIKIIMAEKRKHNIDKKNEFTKAQLGYQTGIKLISLVSEEIYSRFNAMLTANSIIFAIIGLVLISNNEIKLPLLIILSIIGLAFCRLWYLFNQHGIYWQRQFRKVTIELEKKYFTDAFKLISLIDTEDSPIKQSKQINDKKIYSYELLSNYLIDIFLLIYSGIIIFQVIPIFLLALGY